jgi:hypothetical protein
LYLISLANQPILIFFQDLFADITLDRDPLKTEHPSISAKQDDPKPVNPKPVNPKQDNLSNPDQVPKTMFVPKILPEKPSQQQQQQPPVKPMVSFLG